MTVIIGLSIIIVWVILSRFFEPIGNFIVKIYEKIFGGMQND